MIAGIQTKIDSLQAMMPDSFLFVLDSTDRSFIYKSSNSVHSEEKILEIDRALGIENRVNEGEKFVEKNDEVFCIITRLSSHIFMGLTVDIEATNGREIEKVQKYFDDMM